jgi:serine/threonine protein kinase
MNYFEEEHDDIIAVNAEMTGVVLSSGLVSVEDLNRCHRKVDKARMAGNKPPYLLDALLEEEVIDAQQHKALSRATDRSSRERELEQYRIPGYEPIRQLGSGGLGAVILARQISMKRLVALKMLHEKWCQDEEFRSRFLLEARVMGRLSHQNLIQVYDVGREDRGYYFSMEYVDGSTLERVIEEKGPMSAKKALGITVQVARAIDYISSYDIVHRDIKPANIMINRNDVVKLGDFGFLYSKHESSLQKTGYVIGTPDYISPEQASGHPVDFRSDVYSLGVCLYQMLTGDLPYEGTVSSVMMQHVTGDLPERGMSGDQRISPEIYSMICKMMAKNPNDRYRSTQELMEDLQFFEASEGREDLLEEGGESLRKKKEQEKAPSVELSRFVALQQQNRRMFVAIAILAFTVLIETLFLLYK